MNVRRGDHMQARGRARSTSCLLVAVLFFAVAQPLIAQTSLNDGDAVPPRTATTGEGATDDRERTGVVGAAEPANATQPEWVRHLRRAEIVATGTLPLTLLASRLTYSLIRFAYQSIVAGQIELTYAPWFLAPPGAPELTTGEKIGVIGGAAGVSSILAYVDYWLGRREREREE